MSIRLSKAYLKCNDQLSETKKETGSTFCTFLEKKNMKKKNGKRGKISLDPIFGQVNIFLLQTLHLSYEIAIFKYLNFYLGKGGPFLFKAGGGGATFTDIVWEV